MRIILLLAFLVSLSSCSDEFPMVYDDIMGNWSNKNGTTINFKSDHTFSAHNISGGFFHHIGDSVLLKSVEGIWYFDESAGLPAVFMDFEESNILKGDFSTSLLIKERGILSNKPKFTLWFEYQSTFDYDEYEFIKQ